MSQFDLLYEVGMQVSEEDVLQLISTENGTVSFFFRAGFHIEDLAF